MAHFSKWGKDWANPQLRPVLQRLTAVHHSLELSLQLLELMVHGILEVGRFELYHLRNWLVHIHAQSKSSPHLAGLLEDPPKQLPGVAIADLAAYRDCHFLLAMKETGIACDHP